LARVHREKFTFFRMDETVWDEFNDRLSRVRRSFRPSSTTVCLNTPSWDGRNPLKRRAVTNSSAGVVREFLGRPAPQSPLVGRRKAVKHRHVHSIAAVISNTIIFSANIVDAVIDAVAIGSTSTRGPTTNMRFHATKTWVSLLHFDQIGFTISKRNRQNYNLS
jgi:hypothetical protein